MTRRRSTSIEYGSSVEMDETYTFQKNNPDHGDTSSMIGVPAALAAVLIVGGLLAIAVIVFVSPLITFGQTHTEEITLDENFYYNLSPGNKNIASFFTPQVKQWEPQIVAWSNEWGLDANLVATVMQIESCGDEGAVSRSGAMGLFQVMPYHFQSGENAFDPEVNARSGIGYLRKAFDARQGDIHATFASYNGGIQGASLPESLWPEETQRYARWGSGIYTDARSGTQTSPTLEAWMNAGGVSLCTQAAQRVASIEK